MNYGYLGAAWGNQAQQGYQNNQGWANSAAQNRQANNQYDLSRRSFNLQKFQDSQGQRDKMLQFGVGALSGLMR